MEPTNIKIIYGVFTGVSQLYALYVSYLEKQRQWTKQVSLKV
jgi:hypothetical protein